MKDNICFLNAMGIACAIGKGKQEVISRLMQGDRSGIQYRSGYIRDRSVHVGAMDFVLPEIPSDMPRFQSSNNQRLLHVLNEIKPEIDSAIDRYGADRVGVVIGTSTSGIIEGAQSVGDLLFRDEFNDHYHYQQQEMGSPAEFLAHYLNINGPAYTISTACSSSAKVFGSGQRLLAADLCDAVIVGGADTLGQLTVNGFASLEAVSDSQSNPFSANRDGINLGEAATLFLMTKEPSEVALLGVGEASDAHHISAPHPEGVGAATAMSLALEQAGLSPSDIDYLNFHGTATKQNDAMETKAVMTVFGGQTPGSSTKSLTGHTLGAAGALEVGFCWLALSKLNTDLHGSALMPPHVWDNQPDDETQQLAFVEPGMVLSETKRNYCLSNSFAFGGSNVSIVIGNVNTDKEL